ncbi:hypothetical protein [Actinosynnema sp. NPDC020468]|uniref:hypothetical protein n=1 Tax=Actinosynnema sp. NPDC020468 TaxID=3154488 RepID=UPI0033C5A50C
MDVDRALWWSVWWVWAVVWLVTALAIAVSVALVVLAWRQRRRRGAADLPGLTIYLDEKAVMDLYQVGGYGDAMTKEVVDRVGVNKDGKIALKGLDVGLEGARSSGREVVKTYIENHDGITVIGAVLAALESAHGVVHADLRDLTMVRNVALDKHLDGDQRTARLRKVDSYVSVKGWFRVAGEAGGTTTFLAPFGDPDDHEEGAQVRVDCHGQGLRDEVVPDGRFQARCLGKVQSWRATTGELVIRPIAMFQ